MARPALSTIAAAYRAVSTHTEYGKLPRTEPRGQVPLFPTLRPSAAKAHAIARRAKDGAHGSRVSVGDDRGVVEQQCPTAHKSDGSISLRKQESLTDTTAYEAAWNCTQWCSTVLECTKAYKSRRWASRVLKGTEGQ
jgi:hypothetical protein